MPAADNRAAVFLEINQNYSLVSWLLPITIWCSCFSILFAKNNFGIFLSFLLVILFALTLVDRSYLLMGVLALLFRIKNLNFFHIGIFRNPWIYYCYFLEGGSFLVSFQCRYLCIS